MVPPYGRISRNTQGERQIAGLRLSGAIVSLGASLWLATLRPGTIGWLFVALGMAASLGWFVSVVRFRKSLATRTSLFIELDERGLRIVSRLADPHDGSLRTECMWDTVCGIEVDEESLKIRVDRDGLEPLYIDGEYGPGGIYPLAARLVAAWHLSLENDGPS